MANRIVLNETSYHGEGAIQSISEEIIARGLKKGNGLFRSRSC